MARSTYSDEVKASLKKLEWKYSQLGLVKGSHLLLSPEIALNYADDVASIGVANMGVTRWYYVIPNDPDAIADDWQVDYYVGDDTLASENAAEESAAKIREYITTELQDNTAFVSFTLDLPDGWFEELWPPSEPD